jgi:protein-tyrosine phosphatase
MAEFVFKDMLAREGKEKNFTVCSRATSEEEIGNPVHTGTLTKLKKEGIAAPPHRATLLVKEDYYRYDYFLGMDVSNVNSMRRLFSRHADVKIYRLLDFTKNPRDIADPWYTGDFDACYRDIAEGCKEFFTWLTHKNA